MKTAEQVLKEEMIHITSSKAFDTYFKEFVILAMKEYAKQAIEEQLILADDIIVNPEIGYATVEKGEILNCTRIELK